MAGMSKGETTRQAILSHALGLATKVGFEGLTIGRLAADLGMSKSGLFAHFFERWFAWEQSPPLPGGCPFTAAAFELDDRPGPVRDFLVQTEQDWTDVLINVARTAVHERHFRADLDCEQFAHNLRGIMLAYCHASRLMKDPKARARAETAFEALVQAAHDPSTLTKPGARRR